MAQNTRRRIIITASIIVLVVVATPTYATIGRAKIIPAYTQLFYRKSSDGAFRSSFSDINAQLAKLDIHATRTHSTCLNGVSDSGDAWYHYFGETLICDTVAYSSKPKVTSDFRKHWDAQAPALAKQLARDNWKLDDGYQSTSYSLGSLYNTFDPVYTNSVRYTKTFGKFTCNIEFRHGPIWGGQVSDANVDESCQRYVSFFGGYID